MNENLPEQDRFDIANEIENTYRYQISGDLFKWAKHNEDAGRRSRVAAMKLQKLLKNFRKISMQQYKEKLNAKLAKRNN